MLLFALLGAVGAIAYLSEAQNYYTSEETINIDPSGPRVLSETLASAQRSNYLYTQAELIKSTPILQAAIAKPEIKDLKTWQISSGNPLFYLAMSSNLKSVEKMI